MNVVNLNSNSTMPLMGCKYYTMSYTFLKPPWHFPSDKSVVSVKYTCVCYHFSRSICFFIVGTYTIRGQQLISEVIDAALNVGYRAIGK